MILLDYVLLYLYFGLRGHDSSAQVDEEESDGDEDDDVVCEDLKHSWNKMDFPKILREYPCGFWNKFQGK